MKADAKLFQGLFYMAIKDVDIADVEDLKSEFFSKISQICSKSQDNFLTRMYGGSVEIAAMPSFNRPEFYESIEVIAQTVQELEPSYMSGRSFLLDLKLVLAQIATKDCNYCPAHCCLAHYCLTHCFLHIHVALYSHFFQFWYVFCVYDLLRGFQTADQSKS